MGNYSLSAMATGHSVEGTSGTQADYGSELTVQNIINLTTKVEKDFVLNPADYTVEGVVEDRQGIPVPKAVIMAHPMGYQSSPLCAVTDAKDRYFLGHLDGSGTINLIAPVLGCNWVGESMARSSETETVIEIGPAHGD